MALRGDFQGGSAGGGQFLGATNEEGNIAIEKYLKWNWAFFGGAVLVFATSVGTGIHYISNLSFAPATFFSELSLLVFGIIMLVLDVPIPHMQNHRHIRAMRHQIYKFALFMTRFMGRGAWYLFLATMVFGALWDTGINMFLGGVCTLYLTVLGVVALGKGFVMTNKLNRVRDAITTAGHSCDRYVSRGQTGLSTDQFKLMVESATNERDLLTPDELDYAINAISFMPYHDGHITLDELRYWLAPGPPLMV